ncbi:hypothetical protein ACQP2P_19510 [Dactylosporangium sp. CA-139114]|uniref:hypothetical protein n=1 Tax=Dactylosporangium sp. CA-139114 TaxID=3239931 RepID=UPI003D986371
MPLRRRTGQVFRRFSAPVGRMDGCVGIASGGRSRPDVTTMLDAVLFAASGLPDSSQPAADRPV